MSTFHPLEVVGRGSETQLLIHYWLLVSCLLRQELVGKQAALVECVVGGQLHSARNLEQVTINRKLLIGRDGHLDQSEAYDLSQLVREYWPGRWLGRHYSTIGWPHRVCWLPSKHKMVKQCWATVYEAGPTLNHFF